MVDPTDLRLKAPSGVTWTAATNATWDTTSADWTPGSNTYTSFEKVVFDDTSALHNVVIPSAVTPFSVHVTTGGTYTFSGPSGITGIASLLKDGAGTLTITSNNDYSGGTTITAGTLQVGDGVTNGSVSGAITDNATLIFNNPAVHSPVASAAAAPSSNRPAARSPSPAPATTPAPPPLLPAHFFLAASKPPAAFLSPTALP